MRRPSAPAAAGFADSVNYAIKEVLPNGTIKTVVSGGDQPRGVAADAKGDVFVVYDLKDAPVSEILANGTIKTIATGFSNPDGVAVDGAGEVFVADTGHSAIKKMWGSTASQNPSTPRRPAADWSFIFLEHWRNLSVT